MNNELCGKLAEGVALVAEGAKLLAAAFRDEAERGAKVSPAEAPEPNGADGKPPVTIEQVRAVMVAKNNAGKNAKGLLAKYGVSRLTEVRPEDYADLLREAEAL